MNANLPLYTQPEHKQRLIDMGGSGTVYSLVMPESEQMLLQVTSEGDAFLDMYREPWTQKQDAMHEEYFDQWIEWTKPVLDFPADEFPYRYPTAGASEGIVKVMAEHYSNVLNPQRRRIHVFEGEYEGFTAFAESLNIEVVRHPRSLWNSLYTLVYSGEQFWISQPSAIDGEVWEDWDEFMRIMAQCCPRSPIIPDLTYVGAVAADYRINLNYPNIQAVVMSHSKPLGGYYQRVGGVLGRKEIKSLFGNKWFKNLQSLRWGTRMMQTYGVQELPQRYRGAQEEATAHLSKQLGINLKPAAVMLLATCPDQDWHKDEPLVWALRRGGKVRVCVTPHMDMLIRNI